MGDLAGKFLTFDKLFGEGLVRVLYYVGIISIIWRLLSKFYFWVTYLDNDFTDAVGGMIMAPVRAIIGILILRVVCELAIVISKVGSKRDRRPESLTHRLFNRFIISNDRRFRAIRMIPDAGDDGNKVSASFDQRRSVLRRDAANGDAGQCHDFLPPSQQVELWPEAIVFGLGWIERAKGDIICALFPSLHAVMTAIMTSRANDRFGARAIAWSLGLVGLFGQDERHRPLSPEQSPHCH